MMKIYYIFIFITILAFPQLALAKDSLFDFEVTGTVKEGFENNVFLDSSRRGDAFTETSVFVEAKYKVAKDLHIGAEYAFLYLLYHEFTDLSIASNEARGFLEYYFTDALKVKGGYILDFVWYPHDKSGTYFAPGPFVELEYYINDDLYIGSGYEYKIYNYDKKKIRDGAGNRDLPNREDYKHIATFELGQYVKDFLIRIQETIDFNDSNDEYMDYYDYVAYKTTASISFPLLDAFYVTVYGSYRFKDFDHRQNISLNATEDQKTVSLGGRAYYKMYKATYVSVGYNYIQNYSNEPSNRYSDSISSAGIHVFF